MCCNNHPNGGRGIQSPDSTPPNYSTPPLCMQVFDKPFDAPAILVVGHQTDGKSGERQISCKQSLSLTSILVRAWMEALMGCQYRSSLLLPTLIFHTPNLNSTGGSSDGLPVQQRRRRHQDAPPHCHPHEVQCRLRSGGGLVGMSTWGPEGVLPAT